MSSEFGALVTVSRDFGALVAALDDADWERPTRCDPMTVKELVTHVSQAMDVLLLDEGKPPKSTERVIDRVEYGQSWDGAAASSRILAAAQHQAAGLSVDELRSRLDDRIARVGDLLGELGPRDLVGGSGTAIPAAELACVYVIEVGTHTLDLQEAVDAEQTVDAAAAPVIVATLDGLLGVGAQTKTGWDDLTYLLTCTGRRELTPVDRDDLGPLAERFPIIR